MWFIFPQIAGLGYSETAQFYAIKDMDEAKAYMEDYTLCSNLIEISQAFSAGSSPELFLNEKPNPPAMLGRME